MRRLHPAIALLLCLSVGCVAARSDSFAATGGERPDQPQLLRFTNGTSEVVRVFIELGDRQVLLGRAQPLAQTALRLPAALKSAHEVRVLVVIDSPTVLEPTAQTSVRSESMSPAGLLDYVWSFADSKLLMTYQPAR